MGSTSKPRLPLSDSQAPPQELRERRQWVVWKGDKQPRKPAGGPAKIDTPNTWTTYDRARRAVESGRAEGLGFVFTEDDPFVGIDLDQCITDGVVHPQAQALIDDLASYAEVSPSGTGVHIIARGEVGEGRRGQGPWGGHLEVYDRGRYFRMGRPLNGHHRIEPADVARVLEAMGQDPATLVQVDDQPEDDPNFDRLYREGDTSGYESHSEADMALMNMLVARLGREEPFRVIEAFKSSALYRLDKPKVDTYLLRTYAAAVKESPASPKDFERLVQKREQWIRADREARARLEAKQIKDRPLALPEPGWTLADELRVEPPALDYRVNELQVRGTNVLLVAQKKLGKTTLMLNLARSLVDGTPFLDKFEVGTVKGRVAIWNYELTRGQWDRWAHEMDIQNRHLIVPFHARGKGTVPLWVPAYRDLIVDWMVANEVEYWILDPTMKAWEGLLDSEGDNFGANKFLNAIDEIKERAGIPDAALSHHTGLAEGAKERARGPSRLEDWMDQGWYMTGKRDHIDFHAYGRDVDLEKIRITYKPDERRSFSTAGQPSVEATVSEGALAALLAVIRLEDEGVPANERTTNRVASVMRGNKTERPGWLLQASSNGWIRRVEGPRNSKLCSSTQAGRRVAEKRAET